MARTVAFFVGVFLLQVSASSAANAADVYFVAIGSSWYAEAPPGARGFRMLDGANKSARMVGERLAAGGARFGIILTSDMGQYVGVEDINSAIKNVTSRARSDRAQTPFLLIYFAGHGITEGIAWNHFSIPGNFTYRGEPENLPIARLSTTTLHAATLADDLDKIGIPYLVLLDTCYEGTEARFDAPVLSGAAINSLRQVGAVLRNINEFHQENPVVFSTVPGTTVKTVEDPTDPGADRIGPLARRTMIILDSAKAAGRPVTLGDFIARIKSADLDAKTKPAITNAVSADGWLEVLTMPRAYPGPVERRLGTAQPATPCCDVERGPSSRVMRGRITITGGQGEFVTGGHSFTLEGPPTAIKLAQDGPGDLTITIGEEPGAWEISVATADKKVLQKRLYTDAQRYPFADAGHPSLSVTGNGHACNELRGTFQVSDVAYDADGNVIRLLASFRQYCDGSKAVLTGQLDLRAGG